MSNKKEKEEEKPIVAKTAVDLQRLKLMKLMKNPDKPIVLPERPKPKNTPTVPEFVRNVMGSSAGAGSGEFHVYRHLRRKEYARQKFIQEKGHKELLDAQYHEKLEQNRKLAEEATAKKRAKRLKRKQKMRGKKKMKSTNVENNNKENSDNIHSETEDSDSAEETNDTNEVRSDVNCDEVTIKSKIHLETEQLKEVENNKDESEVTCKDTINDTTSTEVEQDQENNTILNESVKKETKEDK
ncbi:PRKR-interacting protein 1 homolog [Vespa velutina]|uniref:PRKR-interacting protein 1 homolog n=1 Tax=Vespa velutina TaxID=202808 RepID=UPI001FB3EB03|nr:PRKR-interacting protein 1 homolog [Vespa velutina]